MEQPKIPNKSNGSATNHIHANSNSPPPKLFPPNKEKVYFLLKLKLKVIEYFPLVF